MDVRWRAALALPVCGWLVYQVRAWLPLLMAVDFGSFMLAFILAAGLLGVAGVVRGETFEALVAGLTLLTGAFTFGAGALVHLVLPAAYLLAVAGLYRLLDGRPEPTDPSQEGA